MPLKKFEGRKDGTVLEIYNASAGSGKTYTLVKAYLRIALAFPSEWTAVLVITFTRKAAAELKDRIVAKLVELVEYADPAACDAYVRTLAEELAEVGVAVSEKELLANAPRVLQSVLFGYDRFWVSTIDGFVQRVVRSFAHESGLKAGLNVELDAERAAEESTALLLDSLRDDDPDLTAWLARFALQNLAEGRRWDVRPPLKNMAAEWLGFELRLFDAYVLPTRDQLLRLQSQIEAREAEVRSEAGTMAAAVFDLLYAHDLALDDLAYKFAGALAYFNKLELFSESKLPHIPEPGKRLSDAALYGPETLCAKKTPAETVSRVLACWDAGLGEWVQKGMVFHEANARRYATVLALKNNFNALGVASDLRAALEEFRQNSEIMMISDASVLMNQIHRNAGAPLLYEKIGSYLRHVFIDEFQDTSLEQWENLRPLMEEGAAAGGFNFLVGDVKQSIYRWRGGDMQLIMHGAEIDFRPLGKVEKRSLSVNYRSRAAVVEFNNRLFEKLSGESFELSEKEIRFMAAAYRDVRQTSVAPGGKVVMWLYNNSDVKKARLEFREGVDDEAEDAPMTGALERLGAEILASGRHKRDFAVLVRTRSEARKVVEFLDSIGVASTSEESTGIGASVRVRLCISALRHIYGDRSELNAATAAVCASRLHAGGLEIRSAIGSATEILKKIDGLAARLRFKGLYSALHTLAEALGFDASDAYIQRFLDVAASFENEHGADVPRFLAWFEEKGRLTGVVGAAESDAVRVMTIHKSKGLEFPVVFVPFAHWDYRWKGAMAPTVWEPARFALNELGIEGPPNWIWPIKLTQNLEHTSFAKRYEQERFGYFTEAMNLLYVALTRARDELHVYADAQSGVGKWLYSAREAMGMTPTADGTYLLDKSDESPANGVEAAPKAKLRVSYPVRSSHVVVRPSVSAALMRQSSQTGAAQALETLRHADLLKNYIAFVLNRTDGNLHERVRAAIENDRVKARITTDEADGLETELYALFNAPPFDEHVYWKRKSAPFVLGRKGYYPSATLADERRPAHFRVIIEVAAAAAVAGPLAEFVAGLTDIEAYAFVYDVSARKVCQIISTPHQQ